MKESIYLVVQVFLFRIHMPLSVSKVDHFQFNTALPLVPVTSRIEYLGENGVVNVKESVQKKILNVEIGSSILEKAHSSRKNGTGLNNLKFTMPLHYYAIFKALLLMKYIPLQLQFQYSEVQTPPLFFQIFFHIPLILSGIVIFLAVLTIDSRGKYDIINKAINGLPCQVYNSSCSTKECSICIDSFSEGHQLRLLPCNHYFHKECIDTWLRRGFRCPLCRARVITQQYHYLYSPDYETYHGFWSV